MPDRDDELSAALQDYYQRMAQAPAPDLTGRIMMSADRRNARIRRWGAVGGGALAAAVVGAVVAIALVTHNQPTPVAPGHTPMPAPSASATPTAVPSPMPTVAPVAGPPVHGFVPSDVTAISADEWWVLGYNGPSCQSASCTRILHTTDGGHTLASIPVPPVAPGVGSVTLPTRMRFADALDGWVFNDTSALWTTHDGGAHWAATTMSGSVLYLEASGGFVDAVVCTGAPDCALQRTPATQDAWSALPIPAGLGRLSLLSVNGAGLWMVPGNGGTSVLESHDSGQHFTTAPLCAGDLQVVSLYAVDGTALWATCATGTQAAVFRSVDSGQHFAQVARPNSPPNFAEVAGTSPSIAVVAGIGLQRTTDGGRTWTYVKNDRLQATIIGFTTPLNGFSISYQPAIGGRAFLFRTNDAGAHWHQVTFP